MLVGGPRASAFGLCGVITTDADQSNFYRAPGWGIDLIITQSIRLPTNNSPDKKRGASKPPLEVLERTRCEKVRKQGETM